MLAWAVGRDVREDAQVDPLVPHRDSDRSRPSRRPATPAAVVLAQEAAATDRESRFRLRREQVARERALARRRHVVLQRGAWILGFAGLLVVGAVVEGGRGAMIAVAVGAVAVAAALLAGRLAARRGASAWDWQAQRYRLHGRPADRVQALDRPDGPRDRL